MKVCRIIEMKVCRIIEIITRCTSKNEHWQTISTFKMKLAETLQYNAMKMNLHTQCEKILWGFNGGWDGIMLPGSGSVSWQINCVMCHVSWQINCGVARTRGGDNGDTRPRGRRIVRHLYLNPKFVRTMSNQLNLFLQPFKEFDPTHFGYLLS